MFAYCMNNPVNMTDPTGNWPQFIENAVNWINDKIIQPVKRFVAGMVKDIKNFDINNQSEKRH